MQQFRVAVHAPDELSVAGLVDWLDRSPGLLPVRWVPRAAAPDVGLVMLDRPAELTALARLRPADEAGDPVTHRPIVLIADRLTAADLREAPRHGVVRVLPRAAFDRDAVAAAVLRAATGKRQELAPPSAFTAAAGQPPRLPQLQPRETDVLQLLADGWDTLEIATKLCYSERTVKSIISNLMRRLGTRSRTHAVACALRAGAI